MLNTTTVIYSHIYSSGCFYDFLSSLSFFFLIRYSFSMIQLSSWDIFSLFLTLRQECQTHFSWWAADSHFDLKWARPLKPVCGKKFNVESPKYVNVRKRSVVSAACLSFSIWWRNAVTVNERNLSAQLFKVKL